MKGKPFGASVLWFVIYFNAFLNPRNFFLNFFTNFDYINAQSVGFLKVFPFVQQIIVQAL
jgi:hypothetical protein